MHRRLDWDPKLLQHAREGILLGECRFNILPMKARMTTSPEQVKKMYAEATAREHAKRKAEKAKRDAEGFVAQID